MVPPNETPAQDNSQQQFDNIIEEAKRNYNNQDDSSVLSSDQELSDNYYPEEQVARDRAITEILRSYGESYRNKIKFQNEHREMLIDLCTAVVTVFVLALLLIFICVMPQIGSINLEGVAALVTASLALVTSIISVTHIITKFCFPENDDEYIVDIVNSILNNTLETKKEENRSAEARNNPNQNQDKQKGKKKK